MPEVGKIEYGRDMERRKFFPARDADHPAYTVPILSHRQQEVIGGLLSLSRVPTTSEADTESDKDTVKLPRESERKTLVDLNPELFPPMRQTMGSVDLALLDEFGSKTPYKKGGETDATSKHGTLEEKTDGDGGPKIRGHAASRQGRKKGMGGTKTG